MVEAKFSPNYLPNVVGPYWFDGWNYTVGSQHIRRILKDGQDHTTSMVENDPNFEIMDIHWSSMWHSMVPEGRCISRRTQVNI